LKLMNALVVAALVCFGAGAVHADTLGDGHVGIGGSGIDPNVPTCGSVQGTTDAGGGIDDECQVAPGQLITSIVFAVENSSTITSSAPNGGLTVTSPLLNLAGELFTGALAPLAPAFSFLDWTETGDCTGQYNTGGVDTCTLNAPTLPTNMTVTQLENLLTSLGVINDGDCDADDFIFGIPGAGEGGNPPAVPGAATNSGCYITYNAPDGTADSFAPNQLFDVATNGAPLQNLPEPGSLALLLVGLTSITFLRRRKVTE